MTYRQRGHFNLYYVALFSAVFAALAMAALWSIRYERNLFAEGVAKVGKMFSDNPATQGVVDSAKSAVADATGTPLAPKGDAKMRKCIIDGKTVISNTDCLDSNPTSKTMKLQITRGVVMPKEPPKPKDDTSGGIPALDKIIDKQLR
ncbi:MAG: DUF4124 domain-containing protein [Pseudomonadota bacterium]